MKNKDSGKKPIHYHEHDPLPEGKFPSTSNVCSATECTGLMYNTPVNREELESYQELSSMEIPREAPGEAPEKPASSPAGGAHSKRA